MINFEKKKKKEKEKEKKKKRYAHNRVIACLSPMLSHNSILNPVSPIQTTVANKSTTSDNHRDHQHLPNARSVNSDLTTGGRGRGASRNFLYETHG